MKRQIMRVCVAVVVAAAAVTTGFVAAAESWPEGLSRCREKASSPFLFVDDGRASADIVLPADDELLGNAGEWLRSFVQREVGVALAVGGADHLNERTNHLVAAVGDDDPLIKRLVAEGKLQLEPLVGEQGFVVQRASDVETGELLVCWSPTNLGCRYGLIEVLRSLHVVGRSVESELGRVVERPQFPMRICYLNFAQHLENAFNPNVLFDVPVNRWEREDWERLIDMVSAFRYNVFEFWLVPSLFSPEAIQGSKIQADFAGMMNHTIAYAKRRGVSVYPIQAVNCVGRQWHYRCPNTPKEHDEILALWDYWSRTLKGYDYIGFFPGDPGGCIKNGCTAETFVDLCLELSGVVRKNNPEVTVEVGTWGSPFAGWGVPLWKGKPDRAQRSMNYLLGKLPDFPPGTMVSINQGFNPDCLPAPHPAQHFGNAGGDGRAYAKRAAETHTVLTWDYSVTEGEGTVMPHCRARRIFDRRREELALGCYSGGICYTMSPKLNCQSIFCCAEAYWNPNCRPEDVLIDYGRLVFGEELAAIGPLLEEFEVVPGWGHYPPFPYSPKRLEESMARLLPLLEKVGPESESRLPLASTMAEYHASLVFFTELFRKCGTIAANLQEATSLAKTSGKAPSTRKELLSLAELERLLSDSADFPQEKRLSELAAEIRQLDMRQLRTEYWNRVYGIYDHIPHPPEAARAQGATQTLFARFHYDLAIHHEPSALETTLRDKGKPFLCVDLGHPTSERGWSLSGWTKPDEYQGERWRTSFGEPGLIHRGDLKNENYRWLVVRLCEGPAGGRKTIAVNGKVIATFERTGPPLDVKREWWVTRSWPIPESLLKDGKLEIRFTDPGVAIAALALAAERHVSE